MNRASLGESNWQLVISNQPDYNKAARLRELDGPALAELIANCQLLFASVEVV
jgi:hypothetical protein